MHRNPILKSYFKDYHLLEPRGLEWEKSKSKLIRSKPSMTKQLLGHVHGPWEQRLHSQVLSLLLFQGSW